MADYGVLPEGYVRKPLSVILTELEASMVTEFGPGVIQTSQSPLGQLNGLMADLLAELEELNLDLYQSIDVDQAEGTRLDILGRLRLLSRGVNQSDIEFRQMITNAGQARVDIQDVVSALRSLDGVTYAYLFTPDMGLPEVVPGTVAVAVLGGDDDNVAVTIRNYIVPGIDAIGNVRIDTTIEGFCRSVGVVRPIENQVDIKVYIRRNADKKNCPAPSGTVIKQVLENGWLMDRINGMSPSHYRVRSIIESMFENVEVVSVEVTKDGVDYMANSDVPVNFYEIISLDAEIITI